MRKNIFTITLIFLITYSYAQQPYKGILPLKDLLKIQQKTGDTIWLPHIYTIYDRTNGQYENYIMSIYEYFPSTSNIKSSIYIMYEDDTLQKQSFFYDEKNRIISTIIQNYSGNAVSKWLNSDRTDQFYNEAGWDSLYINYKWNNTDSIWVKESMKGFSYYYNYGEGFLDTDSTFLWNGQEWVMNEGYKRDYLFNEYGQIYDLKVSLYKNNKWEYDFWTYYHLNNDTTGEYDAMDNYIWADNQWQDYLKFTDVVIHNWQGFGNYVNDVNYEHIVKQWWNGEEWLNINKKNILYDTLGGNTVYQFYWINDDWQLTERFHEVHNERKLATYITYEEYSNNQWDTIWGSNHIYEYLGSIWKVMQLEEYDTALMKWVPTYDHVLSDFTYILNTPDIRNKDKSSSLQIIPNPSNNTILIKLNDPAEKIKTVKVYDIAGREVLEREFDSVLRQEKLDISSLKNGTYIINVLTKEGGNMKGKFIKR